MDMRIPICSKYHGIVFAQTLLQWCCPETYSHQWIVSCCLDIPNKHLVLTGNKQDLSLKSLEQLKFVISIFQLSKNYLVEIAQVLLKQ